MGRQGVVSAELSGYYQRDLCGDCHVALFGVVRRLSGDCQGALLRQLLGDCHGILQSSQGIVRSPCCVDSQKKMSALFR